MQPDRLLALLFCRVFSRGLAYTMFTKFLDFSTSPFVRNLCAKHPQNWGIFCRVDDEHAHDHTFFHISNSTFSDKKVDWSTMLKYD